MNSFIQKSLSSLRTSLSPDLLPQHGILDFDPVFQTYSILKFMEYWHGDTDFFPSIPSIAITVSFI